MREDAVRHSVRAIAVIAGAAGLFGAALSGSALAQSDYPNRPIELIVTFGPGGGADLMGRKMAQLLEPELGVSIAVSNVAGSSGNAGLTRLRTSEPDGYTLATLISLTVASWAAGIGDNSPDDFRVIAVVQSSPSFLWVPAASPHQTADALFEYARQNPGELTVATSGYGTQDDITLQLLAAEGIEMENVPFERPAERYASTVGEHTNVIYEEPGDVAQFYTSGQLKPVIVFAAERHPEFPDVPASTELGYDITGLDNFRTIAAPAGTPDEVIAVLEEAVGQVTASEEWKEFCSETYTCIEPITGEAANAMIRDFHDVIEAQLPN
jgi:tripartite-type tricarboxylate transporter receptor subunit TctC